MVLLKHSDMRIIDEAFQAKPGYVLDFTDRTFREYFEDEFRINIDDSKYDANGSSKMNRLRTFIKLENAPVVARVMRSLWDYREGIQGPNNVTRDKLHFLIRRIEGEEGVARTDVIEQFVAADKTLEELVAAIQRDMDADRPVAALDRLHTYCSKKFGHLLDERGIAWDRSEPLHSRVGKYAKSLQSENSFSEMTIQIIKNANGVFDKFNHLRNNQSLAHDNEIVSKAEARFIFDSVSAMLRFIKIVDTVRFGG